MSCSGKTFTICLECTPCQKPWQCPGEFSHLGGGCGGLTPCHYLTILASTGSCWCYPSGPIPMGTAPATFSTGNDILSCAGYFCGHVAQFRVFSNPSLVEILLFDNSSWLLNVISTSPYYATFTMNLVNTCLGTISGIITEA